jgi:hypothetical protein
MALIKVTGARAPDDGVATEGHPYKIATKNSVLRKVCRGGPPWPPRLDDFCAKQYRGPFRTICFGFAA